MTVLTMIRRVLWDRYQVRDSYRDSLRIQNLIIQHFDAQQSFNPYQNIQLQNIILLESHFLGLHRAIVFGPCVVPVPSLIGISYISGPAAPRAFGLKVIIWVVSYNRHVSQTMIVVERV